MKKLVLVVLLSAGCVRPVDTLGTIQETVKNARVTAETVIDGICSGYAKKCLANPLVADNADACASFAYCADYRDKIIFIFEHINLLIADANLSLSFGDSKSAEETLAKILNLLAQVQKQLRQLGYLK